MMRGGWIIPRYYFIRSEAGASGAPHLGELA